MKTKIILPLVLGIIFNIKSSIAQVYTPFPDSNAVWNVLEFCRLGSSWGDSIWNNTIHYGLFGDSLINSLNYHKLYFNNGLTDSTMVFSSPNTIYNGAIREDTIAKKVYYIPKDSLNESLIYQFNLSLHDTITISTIYGDNKYVCNSIGSILINNHYRKRYSIWSILTQIGDNWIEGIGSINGLLYFFNNPIGNTIKNGLLCFYQNDTLIYQMDGSLNYWPIPTSLYNSGCYHQDLYTSIPENKNSEKQDEIIFPNPITAESILKIPSKISGKSALIEIYDAQGKLIKKINSVDENGIPLNASEFSSGLYIFKLINNSNIYTGKFLVQ